MKTLLLGILLMSSTAFAERAMFADKSFLVEEGSAQFIYVTGRVAEAIYAAAKERQNVQFKETEDVTLNQIETTDGWLCTEVLSYKGLANVTASLSALAAPGYRFFTLGFIDPLNSLDRVVCAREIQ